MTLIELLKIMHADLISADRCKTCGGGNTQKKVMDGGRPRKLTPLGYERLQTLSDNYTDGVSNTARYTAIGNGWTVDVIAHILGGLRDE